MEWAQERGDPREVLGALHTAVTQTADSYLRANNLVWLADQFRKRPDVNTPRTSNPIDILMRLHAGQFEPQVQKIMDMMPKKFGKKGASVNTEDPAYKQAVADLLGQVDDPSPLAKEIRAYFVEVEAYLKKEGVSFKTRQKYFPIMLDQYMWAANREEVIQIAMEELGKTEVEAIAMFQAVMSDPNSMFDMPSEYDPRTAGTFGHAAQRTFGPKEHKAFEKFINTDLFSVIKNYTHSATKHVAISNAFQGPQRVRGGKPADPLHQLKSDLTRMVNDGTITQQVYDRVWNVVLPGLFGQLGSEMNPTLRKMQSGLILFQNIRLLGTAVFASLVDPASVIYRGGTFKGSWTAIKQAMKSLSTEEGKLLYKTMGIIRDDMTESIVNDPTHTQFMSPGVRKWNEAFFRWNGMQYLTNFSRVFSFNMGKQFMLENARANTELSNKRLAELGVNRLDVLEWEAEGASIDLARNENIMVALHQFVDESILRPDASQRPSWMSDQRFLLLAHLKSFIFTYHETILRRVWSQVQSGEIKNPEVLLPFMGFFVLALAISAFGYELRREVMHAGDVPEWARKDAWDYINESVQRAGMLGVMQFVVDSYEAEGRGKMALMSLAGPTASQLEMFFTEDLSYSLPRSLPIGAQSPALREWIREL